MDKKNLWKKALAVVITIALVIGISSVVAMFIHKRSAIQTSAIVENGLSAYELAVQYGYEGTVQEWLDSLQGKSAYDVAVENGYSGTEDDWTSSLKATEGKDGVGIKTAAFSTKNELLITLTDGTVLNLGVAEGMNGTDGKDGAAGTDGKDGANGKDGKDGVGITAASINADGQLVISFSDGHSVNLDKVVGMNGNNGISVVSSEINSLGELVLTYSNGQSANLGKVVGTNGTNGVDGKNGIDGKDGADGKDGKDGADGQDGKDGVSVIKSEINSKGELVITLSDSTVSNLGVVVGVAGKDGINGKNGVDGKDGISVTGAEINSDGELVLIFSNNQRSNLGNVIGADGKNGVDGINGTNGVDGKDGIDGKDGVSIVKSEINSKGELVITLSDNTVSNLGIVVGANGKDGIDGIDGIDGVDGQNGKDGVDGKDGVGIETIVVDNGNLKISLTNDTTLDLGNIKGADGVDGQDGKDGTDGEDGVGVQSTTINEYGELIITYTDQNFVNLGCIVGKDGSNGLDGKDGVGISKTEINDNGELVIIYSDNTTKTIGVVVGKDGADGKDGTNGKDGIDGQDGAKGDKGDAGTDGEDGVGVAGIKLENNELIIILSDTTVINLGNVKGEKGDAGATGKDGADGNDGEDGVGIRNVVLTAEGNLKVTFTTGTTIDLGNVKGADGRGVDEVKIENNILKIKYSDSGTFVELGNVKGEKGDQGEQGVQGPSGSNGASAYDIAVKNGFVGTEKEWLASLQGRSIVKAEIVDDILKITYSDGTVESLEIENNRVENEMPYLVYTELSDGNYSVALNSCFVNAVTSIVIPSKFNGKEVTEIAEAGFKNAKYLSQISMPDTITKIDDYAFYGCESLVDVDIPKKVFSIGYYAFYNCSSIETLTIPDRCMSILDYAFANCSSLKKLTFPGINLGGVWLGSYTFSGCETLSELNIAWGSVASIGPYAFMNCKALQTISIPDTVSTIWQGAFFGSGLTKAYFEVSTGWEYYYKSMDDRETVEAEIFADPVQAASCLMSQSNYREYMESGGVVRYYPTFNNFD